MIKMTIKKNIQLNRTNNNQFQYLKNSPQKPHKMFKLISIKETKWQKVDKVLIHLLKIKKKR